MWSIHCWLMFYFFIKMYIYQHHFGLSLFATIIKFFKNVGRIERIQRETVNGKSTKLVKRENNWKTRTNDEKKDKFKDFKNLIIWIIRYECEFLHSWNSCKNWNKPFNLVSRNKNHCFSSNALCFPLTLRINLLSNLANRATVANVQPVLSRKQSTLQFVDSFNGICLSATEWKFTRGKFKLKTIFQRCRFIFMTCHFISRISPAVGVLLVTTLRLKEIYFTLCFQFYDFKKRLQSRVKVRSL